MGVLDLVRHRVLVLTDDMSNADRRSEFGEGVVAAREAMQAALRTKSLPLKPAELTEWGEQKLIERLPNRSILRDGGWRSAVSGVVTAIELGF